MSSLTCTKLHTFQIEMNGFLSSCHGCVCDLSLRRSCWREQVYFYSLYISERGIYSRWSPDCSTWFVEHVGCCWRQAFHREVKCAVLDMSENIWTETRLVCLPVSLCFVKHRSLTSATTSIICHCISFPFVSAAESSIGSSSCLSGGVAYLCCSSWLVPLLLLKACWNQDMVLGTR